MSILISVIAIIFSAVSPSAMPNNYRAVNTVYASPTLASSVLAVEKVPETQGSVIAYAENEGENWERGDFGTSEGLQLNTARENSELTLIEDLIKQYFEKDWQIMLKVAACESGLIEKAKNKHSTAKGIFQILDGTWGHFKCEGDPFNAEDNIACGKKVLDGQGLSAWSASFKNCWKNL